MVYKKLHLKRLRTEFPLPQSSKVRIIQKTDVQKFLAQYNHLTSASWNAVPRETSSTRLHINEPRSLLPLRVNNWDKLPSSPGVIDRKSLSAPFPQLARAVLSQGALKQMSQLRWIKASRKCFSTLNC